MAGTASVYAGLKPAGCEQTCRSSEAAALHSSHFRWHREGGVKTPQAPKLSSLAVVQPGQLRGPAPPRQPSPRSPGTSQGTHPRGPPPPHQQNRSRGLLPAHSGWHSESAVRRPLEPWLGLPSYAALPVQLGMSRTSTTPGQDRCCRP